MRPRQSERCELFKRRVAIKAGGYLLRESRGALTKGIRLILPLLKLLQMMDSLIMQPSCNGEPESCLCQSCGKLFLPKKVAILCEEEGRTNRKVFLSFMIPLRYDDEKGFPKDFSNE